MKHVFDTVTSLAGSTKPVRFSFEADVDGSVHVEATVTMGLAVLRSRSVLGIAQAAQLRNALDNALQDAQRFHEEKFPALLEFAKG